MEITRERYLLIGIGLVLMLTAALVVLYLYVIEPIVLAVDTGPGISRRWAFWWSTILFGLWLLTAPVWCWASLKRCTLLERRRWPVWAIASLGLVAITIGAIAGQLLGGDPGIFDAAHPAPEDASASVENIFRSEDYYSQMILQMIQNGTMVVSFMAALGALGWSLTALRRDPPPIELTFD